MEDRKRKKKGNIYIPFLSPYLIVLFGFIILPMVVIVVYSVLQQRTDLPTYTLSFENYAKFFAKHIYILLILRSLYYALVSTVVCIIICYPIAYFIAKRKPATQAMLVLLITAPMWINMLLRTLAIKQLLDGPIYQLFKMINPNVNVLTGSDFAVIFGMVYNYVPYMILPIYTSLSKIDPRLLEASTDLGAKGKQTFRNVILPLSIPGVLSGVTIVFLSSATTITITKYLGEGRYFLIGNLIETEFLTNSRWSFGSAMSVILLIVVMSIMWLINRMDNSEKEAV